MKMYKILFCLWAVVFPLLQGCTKGIVDDEVPEEYKSALNITRVYVHSRELFYNKLCGINYEGAPLSNYIQQVTSLEKNASYAKTDVVLKKVTEEGLPGNELWQVTLNLADSVVYSAPNNGWVFVKAEFDKDDTMNPVFIDLDDKGHCSKVKLPVDLKRLVISLTFDGDYLEGYNNEVYEQLNGAPKMGVPGDYSVPRRYVVRNKWEQSDGTHMQRVVEIRVQFASGAE